MRRVVTGASVVLLVLSILGFVGSLLLGFSGDYDKYGSVPVPGTGTVKLPKGEVDMFFVAYTPNTGGGPVTIPDLKFSMSYPDSYTEPVVKDDTGGVVSVNTKEHVRVWKVTVKTAGTYTIKTDGDVSAFIQPQLSFGKGSPAPGWLPIGFALLFVVALAGVIIGPRLDGSSRGSSGSSGAGVVTGPAAVPYGQSTSAGLDPELQQLMDLEEAERAKATAGAATAATPVTAVTATGPPVSAPSTDTPEQSMARLQQLEQLQQLHAAGTLSDSEYDAARKRLGSG